MNKLFLFIFSLSSSAITAQEIAPAWKDFVAARKEGKIPQIPDFSFAGYHWSEKNIPDQSKRKQYRVTDYGALPNDGISDEAGIQAAIHAAEKNKEGGVVFFPARKIYSFGRYQQPQTDTHQQKQYCIERKW